MKKIIFLYMPVLHDGYNLFFQKHQDADEVYLFDKQFLRQFEELDYVKKDIRALDANLVKSMLETWGYDFKVKLVKSKKDLPNSKILDQAKVVLTNDDIGRFLTKKYLSKKTDKELIISPVFLRWDKSLVSNGIKINAQIKVSRDQFEQKIMRKVFKEAEKSSDWWRKVGAMIMKDDQVILTAFNRHLPQNDEQYRNGDPRSFFGSGIGIELTSSIHSELAAVAEAARRGISLEGASIYSTTFPCPFCARAIAHSGIKKVYFAKGYSILDGLGLMESFGIEVVQVLLDDKILKQIIEDEKKSSHIKSCYR